MNVSQTPQFPNQPQGGFPPAGNPNFPTQPQPAFLQPPTAAGPGMTPPLAPVKPKKRAWFKSPWFLAPVTFLLGLMFGAAMNGGSATAESPASTATVTKAAATVTVTSTQTADAKPAATVTVTAAAPAAPAAPAGITDGSYLVGTEIALGTYKSSGGGSLCYADTQDKAGNILEQEVGAQGASVIIRILSGAYTFKSSGCGTWTKVG